MNCSVGNDDLSTGQNPEDHPGITGKIAPTTTTKYITAAIQSNVRSGLLLIPLHQELVCASFWHHDMSIPHSQKVIGGSSDVNTDLVAPVSDLRHILWNGGRPLQGFGCSSRAPGRFSFCGHYESLPLRFEPLIITTKS